MFHLTLFGHGAGDLPLHGCTSLTVFGYLALRRPTLAQRLLDRHAARSRRRSRLRRLLGLDRNLLVTIFGCTEIETPTLAEEYAALRKVLATGAISADECRAIAAELITSGDGARGYGTFTLLGACMEERPSAKKQRAALAAAGLRDAERAELEGLVGLSDPVATEALLRAAGVPS